MLQCGTAVPGPDTWSRELQRPRCRCLLASMIHTCNEVAGSRWPRRKRLEVQVVCIHSSGQGPDPARTAAPGPRAPMDRDVAGTGMVQARQRWVRGITGQGSRGCLPRPWRCRDWARVAQGVSKVLPGARPWQSAHRLQPIRELLRSRISGSVYRPCSSATTSRIAASIRGTKVQVIPSPNSRPVSSRRDTLLSRRPSI